MVLLEVKQSFSLSSNDPSMILPSWQTDKDCCSHWEGVTCDKAGRVTALSLSNCDLAGPIYLGDRVKLNNLESLYLSFNSLSGRIPLSLFTHPALSRLDLSRNQFSGALGEFSNPSLTLTEVILSGNHLCGPVPKSFGWLASLESLSLDHNYFTGSGGGIYATSPESEEWFCPYLLVVDIEMKELYIDVSEIQTDFVLIDLSHNRFHGLIPTTIGKLSSPPKDPKPFTPLASKSKGERFDDIMLHLFIGLGFGGGFSAAVMVRLVYSGRWWHYSSFPTLY
ncbi:leucine-rich repeat protein 1-like [Setaria italica]|uniref:leucine-rich repeat protein 1-like n=1 Tax=Setaria italica TaxID=4555 RepID=UPI000BE57A71|nr:leucine-rich repeat protein 1-like [Setaria italica]